MMTTTNNSALEIATAEFDTAMAAVKVAWANHAACVAWNYTTMRMTQVVCDLQLNAVFAERDAAEKALAKAERKLNKIRKMAR